MLAFITSLRHPTNSADYSRVERLLHDSLRSVLRQEDASFTVWVVGNQRPKNLPASVNFVQVDFAAPSPIAGPITGREAVLFDKGSKLAVGLLAARDTTPTHVMFFDADDLVSRRLAGVVASSPDAPGWYVSHGYRWNAERRSVRVQRDFHAHCGTGLMVRTDLYGALDGLTPRSSQDELQTSLGDRLGRTFGSHLHTLGDLTTQGYTLKPLPFPGALYRVGTGENHSGVSLGGLGRPVGPLIAAEFGVPPTGAMPHALVRSILPSREAFTGRSALAAERLKRRGKH